MAQLLRAMIRLTDLDPEIRELLAAMQSVDLSQLAKDNVQAVFSVSKGFADGVSIRHAGSEEAAIGSSIYMLGIGITTFHSRSANKGLFI